MPACTCCGASAETHKSVDCCVCGKLFKIECVNVSSSEVRRIHQKTGFTWTCKYCRKFGNDLNGLKSVISALEEELRTIKVSILESTSASRNSLIDMEEVIQEISERDKRRNNIVIFGCVESSECTTNNEQIVLDTSVVTDMCSLALVGSDSLKVSRLGKFDSSQENRRRPIKITFPVETSVITILRNISKIRSNPKFSSLSIFRDRTPMQMQLHQRAKAELTDRINKGETDLKIKYDRGIPKIVSSLN